MNWLGKIFLAANILGIWCVVGYMITRNLSGGGAIGGADLVTIVLTALAVMLAILTIFLASLAVWGYSSIIETAKEIAAKVARTTAEEVAGRTTRAIQDQESGQASGDDYARAAASGEDGQPANGG